MDGYVLVDKPTNWTSFDVVAKVRSLARAANRQAMADGASHGQQLAKRVKVGHTGTLDPLATGLLVILVGKYTKKAMELTKLDKTYEVTLKLGEISTTGDEEGLKTPMNSDVPEYQELHKVLDSFIGESMQVPPAYSAVKVDGVRAYKLARQGKDVTLEARPIVIHSLVLNRYEYPYVEFTVDVSSGTYIRTLVEDIGHKTGTGAYMTALRRTKVGIFDIHDACTIEELTEGISNHILTLQ